MDPERWREIERLCQAAMGMEPEKRPAYLKSSCAGDESLLKEVEALLANQSEAEGFMKDPAMEAAAKVLAMEQESALAKDLIGQTITHYRIVEKIGQGGMGEVFLAEDISLNRKVALKFLPPEMQQDAAAHKRLLREAHSAAALDHPYICSIHEITESEGKDFIAMEFVDGRTLQERLAKGPFPLKEAIQIASEVAEALEEAHEKRIIHRDLKPANIMLTRNGHAKVMDFGLAKQLIPPGGLESQEESVTALTRTGMTLGTLAYMSPEQLRGGTIDARSDIFSFGIVLYEMLAGIHPFRKETGMDTASAILKDPPRALGELRPEVPILLQHIVKKMLAKDPLDRHQSIHEVQTDLMGMLEDSDGPAKRTPGSAKRWYWIAATVLVIIAGGIWSSLRFFSREPALPAARFVPVTTSGGSYPSLSPDGIRIAYQWDGEKKDNWDIYVKELDGTGFIRLTFDPADDCCPVWSPDGRQIAFLRQSGDRWILYLISSMGGGERKVAEAGGRHLSWSPDGKKIAFAERASPKDTYGIWSLSLETLEKEQIAAPEPSILGDAWPAFSPDGQYLAFVRRFDAVRSAFYVMRLPRGEPKLVTDYGTPQQPCWTADGRDIIFTTHSFTGEQALWRIAVRGGEPHRVPTRGERISLPTISRNRLAYASLSGNFDIWKMEIKAGQSGKMPSNPLLSWSSSEIDAIISPDGKKIAFGSDRSGSMEIWVCNFDGTSPVKLTNMSAGSTGSPSWSPDGKWITFDSTKSGNSDIYVVSADETGPVRRIISDPKEDAVPVWSRDGRWIYFGSNRSGVWQIWKMPAEGGEAIQITREGGFSCQESSDGYLYYDCYYNLQKKGIWRVPSSGGAETLVFASEHDIWYVTERGIYYVDPTAKPVAMMCFYDFESRRVRNLAPVHKEPGVSMVGTLSVSPDEKWLVYTSGVYTSDIMLIDNFR